MINSLAARIRRSGESGATTIEYAVMLLLVSLAVANFGVGLSGSVTTVFSRMSVGLEDERNGRNGEDERHPNNPHDHEHD